MEAYMDFMMKILYAVSEIRCGFLDFFFSAITHLGEETLFLAIAITVFWCIDKRRGSYVLMTGLLGIAANQALKLAFKIPRPWVYDTSFKPVDGALEEATGYSFPSGHTQNAVGVLGTSARSSKSRPVRVFLVVLILLVAFSRVYLGVHTVLDVIVSLAIGTALLFLLYPIFDTEEHFNKFMPYLTVFCALASVALMLYVFLMPKNGVDEANLYSSMKNASTLLGCTLAMIPVYFIDKCYINFKTDGVWYSQIIKLALGLVGVLIIKSGLSSPLVSLFGNEFVARAVRYFLIVIFAGTVWPLSFKFFSRLRIGFLDRFTEKLSSAFGKKS